MGHVFVRRTDDEKALSFSRRCGSRFRPVGAATADLPEPYRSIAVPEERLRSAEARAHGRALFLQHCALCHGERADGRGVRQQALSTPPRDFTDPAWRARTSPRQVFHVIREGSPGTPMPAWKSPRREGRLGPDRVPARRRGTAVSAAGTAHRGPRDRPGRRLPPLGLPPRPRGGHRRPGLATTREGVTIEAFGRDDGARRVPRPACARAPPPAARIRELAWTPIPAEPATDFVIVASRGEGRRRVSIPPDLATCADCLRGGPRSGRPPLPLPVHQLHELRPALHDRPRRAVRPAGDDDGAVSRCAPTASASTTRRSTAASTPSPTPAPPAARASRPSTPTGERLDAADPIRRRRARSSAPAGSSPSRASAASTSPATRPRRRPSRGCAAASGATRSRSRSWCATSSGRGARRARPSAIGRSWLRSSGRSSSSRAAAGAGSRPRSRPRNPLVGLLLPYTPLHHLLLADAGRPLVMTSGNLSEEPIAYRERRGPRAARAASPTSSSCTTARSRRAATTPWPASSPGAPVVLRRSRGYVPRGVPVRRPFERPVLACGAHLKNTFCLGLGDTAWLGPHIGDLDEPRDRRAPSRRRSSALERFLGVRPEIIAHDLHPALRLDALRAGPAGAGRRSRCSTTTPTSRAPWPSTGSRARSSASPSTARATAPTARPGAASCCSRTPTGSSGSATLRPIALPAATTAIREVWRIALALLDDAFDGDPPLDAFPSSPRSPARRLDARPPDGPRAASTRRSPTASAATSTRSARSSSRGPSRATRARSPSSGTSPPTPRERGAYPFELAADEGVPDARPAPARPGRDGRLPRRGGARPRSRRRFHNTLAGATAALVRAAAERRPARFRSC